MMSSTIPTGTRLGRYEIQRLLGANGMGKVLQLRIKYRARVQTGQENSTVNR